MAAILVTTSLRSKNANHSRQGIHEQKPAQPIQDVNVPDPTPALRIGRVFSGPTVDENHPSVNALRPRIRTLAERFGVSEDWVADLASEAMRKLDAADHSVAPGPLLDGIIMIATKLNVNKKQNIVNLFQFYVIGRNERGMNHEAAVKWLLDLIEEDLKE